MRTASDVINEYLNLNLRATNEHEPSCVFYLNEERLRLATSNTSCKGCAFYSANKAARTEALAKLLLDSEEEKRKMRHQIAALDWLLKQEKEFARIGRAVIKWRNRHD